MNVQMKKKWTIQARVQTIIFDYSAPIRRRWSHDTVRSQAAVVGYVRE